MRRLLGWTATPLLTLALVAGCEQRDTAVMEEEEIIEEPAGAADTLGAEGGVIEENVEVGEPALEADTGETEPTPELAVGAAQEQQPAPDVQVPGEGEAQLEAEQAGQPGMNLEQGAEAEVQTEGPAAATDTASLEADLEEIDARIKELEQKEVATAPQLRERYRRAEASLQQLEGQKAAEVSQQYRDVKQELAELRSAVQQAQGQGMPLPPVQQPMQQPMQPPGM